MKIFKYFLTLTLVFATAISLIAVAAPSASAAESAATTMLPLEWMRSGESDDAVYKRQIVSNKDAWNYSTALNATPLKYFQTAEAKNQANTKASLGKEAVNEENFQLTGYNYIWDSGMFYNKYQEDNKKTVAYDWASWKHYGTNGMASTPPTGNYSIRRFATYIDLSDEIFNNISKAILAPQDEIGNMSYLLPINDTFFVFVNGQLAFWGGTDIIAGGNQYNALIRSEFGEKAGISVRNGVNGTFKNIYPHTDGWCVDLESNAGLLDIKSLLKSGQNRIDIFVDDFYDGGGMNKLNLFLETTGVVVPPPERNEGHIIVSQVIDPNDSGEYIPYEGTNGDITYELYKEEDGELKLIDTGKTDGEGKVEFSTDLTEGETYYIKEKLDDDQKSVLKPEDEGLIPVTADKKNSKDPTVTVVNDATVKKGTELSWNNGNASGLNSFKLDGVQIKQNKSYIEKEDDFNKALAKAGTSTPIYTVLQRDVLKKGVYVKAYFLTVGIYENNAWKIYSGSIIVDNAGGNNDKQIVNLIRIK